MKKETENITGNVTASCYNRDGNQEGRSLPGGQDHKNDCKEGDRVPKYGNEYRITPVCVDNYCNAVLEGRFYNNLRQEGVRFLSTIDFLRSVEDMMDAMQFPQAFSGIRRFQTTASDESESPGKRESFYGSRATFHLKIFFRQNTSWQGTIRWVEGKKEESFRSVLELLFLMDSALRESAKD